MSKVDDLSMADFEGQVWPLGYGHVVSVLTLPPVKGLAFFACPDGYGKGSDKDPDEAIEANLELKGPRVMLQFSGNEAIDQMIADLEKLKTYNADF